MRSIRRCSRWGPSHEPLGHRIYALGQNDSIATFDSVACSPGAQSVNTVNCVPRKEGAREAARPSPLTHSVESVDSVTVWTNASTLPSPGPKPDAAALLRHIRDVLPCRVTPEGELVMIRPTHCCPPPVVEAAQRMIGELVAILRTEA